MYVKREKEKLKRVYFMCLEDLVPEGHLLQEIDAAIVEHKSATVVLSIVALSQLTIFLYAFFTIPV